MEEGTEVFLMIKYLKSPDAIGPLTFPGQFLLLFMLKYARDILY